jgi:hypothetical protein
MMMDAQEGSALLTAEQMRDAVSRLVRSVNAGDPGELARGLFREDGEFSEALMESVPRLVSAAAQAVKAFVESVEGMPAEKGADLVARSYGKVDGSEIGEAVNAVSRLIIRLHEQDPELFTANKAGVVSDAMQAMDFGKLRKAITYRAGEQLGALRREVELLGDNPVALINLFGTVSPVVNDAIELLKAVIAILALPPEAMTYALLKIVEDIDWREFASLVNGVAAVVVALHRGNYILGDGALYSKGPLSHIASEMIASLDGQVLAEALASIGEEGEVLISTLANQIMDKESMLVPLTEAVISLANSSFGATASILEKADSLPPETMHEIARMLAEDLEVGELGRALGFFASYHRRLSAEYPGLYAKMLGDLLSSSGFSLEDALAPEKLGARANQSVSAYNTWVKGNPGRVTEGLDVFLASIDPQQFDQAARSSASQVADALSRHPEVMKAAFKALVSILYQGTKGYVVGFRGRRNARRGVS